MALLWDGTKVSGIGAIKNCDLSTFDYVVIDVCGFAATAGVNSTDYTDSQQVAAALETFQPKAAWFWP